MNIAIISPNNNSYSETFIQAHKNLINGNVFFYYSGFVPTKLEDGVLMNSRKQRILDIIKGHFNLNKFSLPEKAIIASFKKNKIEVVLVEYGVTAQKMLKVCIELKLPLIVHFHGYDASVVHTIIDNNNYRDVFKTAKYVVAVSKKMYQDLLKLGCPEDILIYNVCGPQDKFFEVIPKFNKQQFLAVGRFVDKKAPYYLILTFLKVIEKYPDAKLLMAGDGELLDTCKNLVKHYKLQKNIEFLGVITPEKYRELLTESIAFVQHSITAENGDSEGTPVGILEASAAGLPIISTKHAGIPDVILNQRSGFLTEEHDTEGMAENIITLIENPELAREMGAFGKQNIKENFNLKKHINILNDLLEKAVK